MYAKAPELDRRMDVQIDICLSYMLTYGAWVISGVNREVFFTVFRCTYYNVEHDRYNKYFLKLKSWRLTEMPFYIYQIIFYEEKNGSSVRLDNLMQSFMHDLYMKFSLLASHTSYQLSRKHIRPTALYCYFTVC